MLMVTALFGMGVMALIVKVNMSARRNSSEERDVPEKTCEPEKNGKPEVTGIVEAVEPGPADAFDVADALSRPVVIQAAELGLTPEPVVEPSNAPTLGEAAKPAAGPQTEAVDEDVAEPWATPIPEAWAAHHERGPAETVLRREAEDQFFDLSYEYTQQITTEDVPTILDEAPSLEYEEEEDEPLPVVVKCPHCKSEVPQTLYCIYCGNTLRGSLAPAG